MTTTETWAAPGSADWGVVEYDENGIAHMTRDALHELLTRAGFRQVAPEALDKAQPR